LEGDIGVAMSGTELFNKQMITGERFRRHTVGNEMFKKEIFSGGAIPPTEVQEIYVMITKQMLGWGRRFLQTGYIKKQC